MPSNSKYSCLTRMGPVKSLSLDKETLEGNQSFLDGQTSKLRQGTARREETRRVRERQWVYGTFA